jgi:hypothetical protein
MAYRYQRIDGYRATLSAPPSQSSWWEFTSGFHRLTIDTRAGQLRQRIEWIERTDP